VDVPALAERIMDNVGRVDRMMQDLLDALKVQTGARFELELEEGDLVSIVRDALQHSKAELGERLVLDTFGPVRGYFAGDGLRRAVENLVSNAVKYGSPATPIVVSVRAEHGRALLTVHNHGTHIPAEEQETLFRAFQRTAGAQRSGKEGWGLGLAQVRAVAEAHGGSIAVDSLPGSGTTFTIDIPTDARPFQERIRSPLSRS
jgi:signal transduction histidine kinase